MNDPSRVIEIRELIINNFKINKENLNKKSILKHLINIILSELKVSKIEAEVETQNQRETILTFKLIKKNLNKPQIISYN